MKTSLDPDQGFFQQFWEKAPGQIREKMTDLTSKLGEINNIEYNKDSKTYPQNKVISISVKYHSDMGHCFS